jgi:amino acid adenylation domain-containing protein
MTASTATDDTMAFRASYAQERMWLAEQVGGDAPAYNVRMGLRFHGQLDRGALERALTDVIERHEVLRTNLVFENGELNQLIRPATPVALQDEDFSATLDPAAQLEQYTQAAMRRPFSQADGLLIRPVLVRLAADEHALLVTMDHLIADPWSTQVLHDELVGRYAGYHNGRPSPLPPPAIQYADYAVWQREWLSSPEADRQVAYWRRQLGDGPARLTLPPPARPAASGPAQHIAVVPDDVVQALQAFAQQERASLFMALFAAFSTLLSRYTRQVDVAIGCLLTGRTRPETEHLIGFFANAVVLRVNLGGAPSFRQLLQRVREVSLAAHEHQEVPFDRVVAELHADRGSGRRPFFDIGFQYADVTRPTVDLPGLRIEPLAATGQPAPVVDLGLTIVRDSDGHTAIWDYDGAMFDAAYVERLHDQLLRLAHALVAAPDRPVGEAELLGPGERGRVAGFQVPGRGVADDWSLSTAFEEQVRRSPDALAVDASGVRLSYDELNRRANRLAHALRTRGVGAETLVGVLLGRGLDMITSALAVHKAGGGYVPLDPVYPTERIAFMLADAEVRWVLTRRDLAERLPEATPVEVVLVDDLGDARAEHPDTDPPAIAGADSVAYVIYTSGSTGTPKGVVVGHRGLAVVCTAQRSGFPVDAHDRVLHLSSPSFDASILEVMTALAVGATSCVPDMRDFNTVDVDQLVAATGATIAFLPPSLLAALPGEVDLPSLHTIVTGAEAVPATVAARWGVGRRLFNMYGPTEATIVATRHLAGPADTEGGSVPIGRPLPGVLVYVLDPYLNPVPPWVAGELYLGGDVLARGYLNRPGLTAERFVPDPTRPGARLYHTGDLARWREDGTLEFLGRVDDQVKLRGYRIELGEVENCLLRHPDVQDAAVLVRNDSLVGYVAVAVAAKVSVAELREHCIHRLPEQMVPGAIVLLDRLPMGTNGKVDRAALRELGDTPRSSPYVAPRTPMEAAFAAVLAEVLDHERVGATDDFFELGGNSLAAARVVTRLREELDLPVTVRTLFDHPVLADLVAAVTGEAVPAQTAPAQVAS